jgi:hypothetical protein
VKKWEE